MSLEYYQHVRSEIAPLLPSGAGRVLEVGCGGGHTLRWLKDKFPAAETVGIDGFEGIRSELQKNADVAHIRDLEQPLPDLGRFDLVLALDVLEHLREPERLLASLSECMNPDATLIVSVPNVSHLSVALPLLLRRRFEYADGGILDRTHLRFYVESTALGLLNQAGFRVDRGLLGGIVGPRARMLNLLSLGGLRHHLAKQYIMAGRKHPTPITQTSTHWDLALGATRS